MRIRIEAHDLPGRRFVCDGQQLENVHVGVQVGSKPEGLVRGDAASARWEVAAAAVVGPDGGFDLRGQAVHGRRGERFLYLTWGDVGADGSFSMFRRAKLMVADIEPVLLEASAKADGTLIATIGLTDDRGGPRCARVRPPGVAWRAG